MRSFLDSVLRAFVRLVLGVFFRQVEVTGLDRVPAGTACIFVGNHGNSLIDPALALGWLPKGIRFLAKSTLWRHPLVGPFVRLAGAVPVYRQQDRGVDTTKNREMFARCWEILGTEGSIALFPEGLSHSEPRLQPLKTGAARIALGTLGRTPGLELSIIPFGLHFEARTRFRSAALIEIGAPVDARGYLTSEAEDDQEAVRQLTDTLQKALGRVTIDYDSWEEAHLIRRAATLYSRDEVVAASGLAGKLSFQRAFAQAYGEIKNLYPNETQEVRGALREYDRRLRVAGLTDRQVAASYPRQLVVRFVLRHLLDLLILLPVGTLGALVNWLPYRIPAWVVGFLPLDDDLKATYKLMTSIVLFPIVWLGLCRLAFIHWGWPAALAVSVAAPLSGYVALLLKERLARFVTESRAYLILKSNVPSVRRLRQQREALLKGIRSLVNAYLSTGEQTPGVS